MNGMPTSLGAVAAIADAVLYEGFILYPYRPSSLKNQQRWSFGSVFPRDFADFGGADPSTQRTTFLVQGTGATKFSVRVRFLQLVVREIGRLSIPLTEIADQHSYERVAALTVGDRTLIPWDEAIEREVLKDQLMLGDLSDAPVQVSIMIPASREMEPIRDAGEVIGVIMRNAAALEGTLLVSAEPIERDIWRVTAFIENHTPLPAHGRASRDAAQRFALASLHSVFTVENGAFMSLTDPPEVLRHAAAECENQGCWPVLVGPEGSTDTLLSSPIILPDYPEIAPESPGDLFDGCEIDEILTLRILTMTDAEKREMVATDPRARALLERTEALTEDDMISLHGALRRPGGAAISSAASADSRWSDTKPRLAFIDADGKQLTIGDRVRLKPRKGADIMDVVLENMVGIVEDIERDFEDKIHLAITIEDDPGRDFGRDRFPGHRFFYAIDEVEPIQPGDAA